MKNLIYKYFMFILVLTLSVFGTFHIFDSRPLNQIMFVMSSYQNKCMCPLLTAYLPLPVLYIKGPGSVPAPGPWAPAMKIPALLVSIVLLAGGETLQTCRSGQLEVHQTQPLLWRHLWAQAKHQLRKLSPTSPLGSNNLKKARQFVNYRNYMRSVGKRSKDTLKNLNKKNPNCVGMAEVIHI